LGTPYSLFKKVPSALKITCQRQGSGTHAPATVVEFDRTAEGIVLFFTKLTKPALSPMLLLVINYRIQLTCKEEMRGRRNAAEVTDLAVPRQNTFDNICSVRAGAFGRGGGWVANNYFRECRRM
jgi:hypothetical protein